MLKKTLLTALKILAALVIIAIIALAAYIIYMQVNYYRIDDFTALDIENVQTAELSADKSYTAVTYNIGFGAYDQAYSFFMDTGVMADGTPVQGESGKARSAEAAEANTNGAISEMKTLDADFYLLQEADRRATRSYYIDQTALIKEAFTGYESVFAQNFHSAFLAYPLHDMHGSVDAGLLTLSRYEISDAVRRSYPVSTSFLDKFFDLDRCFSVQYLPVENSDKQLVLINSHMSAYDEGGTIRAQQLQLLCSVLQDEYNKGNYVIVGGDFNHVLDIPADAFASQQQVPAWVAQLTASDLPQSFAIVHAENELTVPTCRACDIPYTKGVNYTSVLDGFIVSDNITAAAENIDADFMYSDHNPVKLTFELTA